VTLKQPISFVICEQPFSVLPKINTWLRFSIGQNTRTGLTNLSILPIVYIEKCMAKLINVNKVINTFLEQDKTYNFCINYL